MKREILEGRLEELAKSIVFDPCRAERFSDGALEVSICPKGAAVELSVDLVQGTLADLGVEIVWVQILSSHKRSSRKFDARDALRRFVWLAAFRT